jgi:LPS-assembly protein
VQQLAELRYQPEPKKIIGLAYRAQRDTGEPIKQIDLIGSWPVTREISAVGRWNYSLHDAQDFESLLGVEYRSCCWAFRVAARRYVDGYGTLDQGIYMELELTGLGQMGRGIQEILSHTMVGNETIP